MRSSHTTTAHARKVPGDPEGRLVRDALVEERPRLLALPEHPYDCHATRWVTSGKQPYVRFDRNDYSIPHHLVGKPLVLVATEDEVRITNGSHVFATHKRSADPFIEALAVRGEHLGGQVARLLKLIDRYDATELEAALKDALARGAIGAASVAHVLDQRARARRQAPKLDVILPDDPRVRDLRVTPHALDSYDALAKPTTPRSSASRAKATASARPSRRRRRPRPGGERSGRDASTAVPRT